jgi:hypothetical protein
MASSGIGTTSHVSGELFKMITGHVHESGLFQGKLGFELAIVLLEDGCEEFSNIRRLNQIRFPKGNIAAVFWNARA